MDITAAAREARKASVLLPELSALKRIEALEAIKATLIKNKVSIFEANSVDLQNAKEENLPAPLLGRLGFDEKKLQTVCEGIDSLIALKDIVGKNQLARELTPGLNMYKVTCPIGVLGVIFESRPDALVQIAALCVKSGNAVLLKGGHEAVNTNRALYNAVIEGAGIAGLPSGWAQLLETREDVNEMLSQEKSIDLIIPRGSNAFVRYIMQHTNIPVMGHADGICHVYIDRSADIGTAVRVAFDSKTQNYSVCNAAETFLVHRDIAAEFLPAMQKKLHEKNVEIRGDEQVRKIIDCAEATDDDWHTEYLDAIISIRIVDDIYGAIDHINTYGSHHTDCIITEDPAAASVFEKRVDSAGVYVNCSTRFADGFRYGFGAEVGVSTAKLHARGPVGIDGLCTYKYVLRGHGNTVEDTMNGKCSFTHIDLKE
ncbi:MAG: glutamate-5-semialdehyde dehydrogenase [Clostridiales bacterium]|nr:glutamate-5-semialdehyde dehydrogenase [Clostridiales bacterium]